ncbi:thyroglobulin-like [Ylistrum balloti]|uniref:thyroglobulin-like n=1 Tax=Ylistrum balloti TaxID=509963 RepID=UPI0029058C71|nr:thyroglobulin-like [Ylistrum balloti]
MKIAILTVLLAFIVAFAAGVSLPVTCEMELAAIEAEIAELTAQNNGMPPVGYMKPDCLVDGTYAPRQCLGSVCKCVTAEGSKLTEDFSIGFAYKSDCACARRKHEYSLKKMYGKFFDCNPIGSYNPIQCTGSVCYCVDYQGNQVGPETANIGSQDRLNC